jgi:hypothetical protein
MTREPWSDGRLAAAFERRAADGPVPRDLVGATLERTRTAPRPVLGSRWSLGPRLAALAASGLAIAVLGVLAGPLRPNQDETRPSPAPGAHGLPVLTVPQALGVRDAGDGREVAVRGYFSVAPAGVRCPPPPSTALNPVRLECPGEFAWLLATPEPLDAVRSSLPANRVGFQPLLPGLDLAALGSLAPAVANAGTLPEVVLIGHFHDRRGDGALCDVPDATRCDGFVVDAIGSIDGLTVGSSTVIDMEPLGQEPRREPVWSVDEVDRLLLATFAGLDILSRVALPGHRVGELEPALGTGAHGVIDRSVAWLVNGLQPTAGQDPVLRTFVLVDGDPGEAWEAGDGDSRLGFRPIELAGDASPIPVTSAEPATSGPSPTPSSPTGATFPAEWLGLPVISTTEAIAFRDTADDRGRVDLDTELAVSGHLVFPPLLVVCPLPRIDIEPLDPGDRRCPARRAWLLDTPEPPWDIVDGVRMWHRPIPEMLQPIVNHDVPFEVPHEFADAATARPMPVVLLGHFGDQRFHPETLSFIVDALVWRAGEPAIPTIALNGAQPSEDRAGVEARVNDALGPAIATWAAVVDGAGLTTIHTSPEGELTGEPAVWQLSRLVEEDGRRVVRFAWTADGGHRIWELDRLAPERRLEVGIEGGRTIEVEVVDWPDIVESAVLVEPGAPAPVAPRIVAQDVAVPFTLSNPDGPRNDLRIRWTATDCDERWTITISDGGRLDLYPSRTDDCLAVAVDIDVVLTFVRPLPAEGVDTGGGGAGG